MDPLDAIADAGDPTESEADMPDAGDVADVPGEEPSGGCTVDLGDLVPGSSSATLYADGVFVDLYVSGGPTRFPFTLVDIESWFDDGGPREPVTVTFDGSDAPDTCSLCMLYWERCDGSWECEGVYFAVSGTLELDAMSDRVGETVAGTATDVVFVWFDTDTGERDPSRTICLRSVSFSESLVWGG